MKKRTKKYRPKPVVKPLGIKNLVTLELPSRVAQSALGSDWIDIKHLRDIGSHAMLAHRIAKAVGDEEKELQAEAISDICVRVEERFERTGRAGTTGDEMIALRALLDETLPWINQQSNVLILRESDALVRNHDRRVAELARKEAA